MRLMVKGRKDGIMREVRHIPVHGGAHQTRVENREKQFRGFLMILGGHPQVIHEDRITEVKGNG